MKKTLMASAIAAATLSTGALAMEQATDRATELAIRLDSMPTLYGNIQLVWSYTDTDDGSTTNGLGDNGSTVGLKHTHEISPGLEGFFKLEFEGDADNKETSEGIGSLDEAYLGVRGDFGEVWVGSDDSQFETLIEGINNYYEFASQNLDLPNDTGEGDLLQYTSPSFGGLSVLAAVGLNGDDAGGSNNPYQLGLAYEMDSLTLAFAMDSNDGGTGSNENIYGLAADFNAGDLGLRAEYSIRADDGDDPGFMFYGLLATYSLGANTFAASFEYAEPDEGDGDASVISLQALHNLSERMYVYVEGYFGDYDVFDGTDGEVTDLAIGAAYAF